MAFMVFQDEIHIAAAPSVVWAVTVDIRRWPEWTPTITSVVRSDEGPLKPGSKARIKQPGQPESVWTITEFAPEEQFAWESQRTGLRMKATHRLVPDGPGTTHVLRLEATGPLAVLFWPLLALSVPRALSRENRGLKARCEA